MNQKITAALLAILAAALYAIHVPFSKFLLVGTAPTVMAALLYLGAGAGLLICGLLGRMAGRSPERDPLTARELPYTLGMIVLDIAAPIFLMMGIARTSSAAVSLLNNFEIVATSLIALLVFREAISRRLWTAICLVVAAGIVLGLDESGDFVFSGGSLFVLAACVCWGLENNCTRQLSVHSPVKIVVLKGCFSGLGSLIVAGILREPLPEVGRMAVILLLGFVSYGLSIFFYIRAQRDLGAARTSAFYSAAPFLGVAFSMILGERPSLPFYAALVIMVAATVLMIRDTMTEENER